MAGKIIIEQCERCSGKFVFNPENKNDKCDGICFMKMSSKIGDVITLCPNCIKKIKDIIGNGVDRM